jgi:predicted transposase/invertase (TIGR01784 family)
MDFMFKQLFGHPSRKSITMAFLNALLHRTGDDRIIDVQFENTELTKETEDGKTGRLDVIVRTNRGEHIHVEIQIIP